MSKLNKALPRLRTVPSQARRGNPLAGFVLCPRHLYLLNATGRSHQRISQSNLSHVHEDLCSISLNLQVCYHPAKEILPRESWH